MTISFFLFSIFNIENPEIWLKNHKKPYGKNKIVIAVFLTIAILTGVIILSTTLFSNKSSDESTSNSDNVDKEAIIKKLAQSSQSGLQPQEVINQTIQLSDLPVYPIAWQEKFFKLTERNNELVAGPAADYDKDGLSNKEEYFQGSDPTNPDTLCDGKTDDANCQGKNDSENVKQGISPLTGLQIDTPKEFVIKRQDVHILDNIQDTFETAAREGVDFPTLYILAKTIDLSSELDAIKVIEQKIALTLFLITLN
ncbi:hypothetical protein HC766_04550 [Candidatus Gracilibacteria bacterium]|nr:hypothetical protein [Candidatus Gracilibacteria bacterium]